MNELVQLLSQKTGLSPDKAQEVVNVVLSHLKEKLPAPLASVFDSYFASGPAEGGSVTDKASSIASELGSMFGR